MRCFSRALAVVAAPLIPLLVLAAPSPNFSGTWEMDAARSPGAEGRTITVTIHDASGKISFKRVVRQKDGKEETSQFSCEVGGNQCDFAEGGHTAKVSLWYNGAALMILKTDGPKEDAVTQWKLELSPDGKTLNVEYTKIDPTDKPETLVFDKKSS
jgi:hypothetical protein